MNYEISKGFDYIIT